MKCKVCNHEMVFMHHLNGIDSYQCTVCGSVVHGDEWIEKPISRQNIYSREVIHELFPARECGWTIETAMEAMAFGTVTFADEGKVYISSECYCCGGEALAELEDIILDNPGIDVPLYCMKCIRKFECDMKDKYALVFRTAENYTQHRSNLHIINKARGML